MQSIKQRYRDPGQEFDGQLRELCGVSVAISISSLCGRTSHVAASGRNAARAGTVLVHSTMLS